MVGRSEDAANRTPSRFVWTEFNDTHHRILAFLPWIVFEVFGWAVGVLVDGLVHGYRRGRNLWV